MLDKIENAKKLCEGASRAGANGAKAKLEYVKPCLSRGVRVIIASAEYDIADVLSGKAPATRIYVKE